MTHLKGFDLLALGFMTFALFLGAGNIIFPPSAGMAAGEHVWSAAFGFLLTGVGLPLLTVVALARVGGGIGRLTQPIGRRAGVAFAIAVYLAIGPLFATRVQPWCPSRWASRPSPGTAACRCSSIPSLTSPWFCSWC